MFPCTQAVSDKAGLAIPIIVLEMLIGSSDLHMFVITYLLQFIWIKIKMNMPNFLKCGGGRGSDGSINSCSGVAQHVNLGDAGVVDAEERAPSAMAASEMLEVSEVAKSSGWWIWSTVEGGMQLW